MFSPRSTSNRRAATDDDDLVRTATITRTSTMSKRRTAEEDDSTLSRSTTLSRSKSMRRGEEEDDRSRGLTSADVVVEGWISKKGSAFPYKSSKRYAEVRCRTKGRCAELWTFEGDEVHKRYNITDLCSDENDKLVFVVRGGGEVTAELLDAAAVMHDWLAAGAQVRKAVSGGLKLGLTATAQCKSMPTKKMSAQAIRK